MSEEVYNIDEIIDFGTTVPVGDYVAKMIDVDVQSTKAGDPTVVVTFEVAEGEYKNLTFDKVFFMKQGKTKNGGTWCRGINDLKADARAIRMVSSIPRSFTLQQARKVFAEVYGKKKLEFSVRQEPAYNDPTKMYNRYNVTGVVGGTSTASHESAVAELLG